MFVATAFIRLTLAMTAAMPASTEQSALRADRSSNVDAVTVVYLVRHAEKSDATPADRDPPLSAAGRARSASLTAVLESVPLAAAYATEYKRTQQTAEGVATSHGLSVTIADARNPAGLVARITTEMAGRSVLVAGHSNTVPAVINALGIANPPELSEFDYNDLFVVTLAPGAEPTLLQLHYGAPDPSAERSQQLTDQAAAMLDAFHEAAARADEQLYFACFEPDALYLGTDANERWTLDEFKAFAMPYFQRDSAWTYTVVDRKINISPDLAYAWFDEQLDNAKYGRCRGAGVLRYSGGQWRIAQYHLTIPVPNELATDFAKRIREYGGTDQ